jgi:uncharacterized protein (TIGR03545 family)
MSFALSWHTVVQRVLLAAVIVLAGQYGVGRAVRSIASRSGEAFVNVPLEVAHARVSITGGQVVLSDVRCPNPYNSRHKLLEADRVLLDVAGKPLLHKQAVIDHGTVVGLSINTAQFQQTANNQGSVRAANAWFTDAASERASQWLKRLDERFGQDLVPQFESVARTEQVCARWSAQSAELDRQMRQLKQRADALQKSVDAAQSNPLRHRDKFSSLPHRLSEMRSEFDRMNATLQQQLDSLEADRRAIVAARQRDEQLVNDRLILEPISPSELTAYLLRREVAKPLDELVAWLRWLRQVAPVEPAPPRAPTRGEDVLFAGCGPVPNFLVRALQLQGASRLGGQPVELRGMLTDFTTAPSLHSRPIQLRVKTTGSLPLELQATIDRTREPARDEVIASFQGLLLPKHCFGQADEFCVWSEPSAASASAHVVVIGRQLNGDIQFAQTGVRLVPMLQGTLSDLPISLALHENLRAVDSLALRIALSGTLDEPRCTLWSNLGPAVAEAMEAAVKNARRTQARALLARGERHVDERLATLERRVSHQHAQLIAQVSSTTSALEKIAGQQNSRQRLSHEQLGRRLPANSLFR